MGSSCSGQHGAGILRHHGGRTAPFSLCHSRSSGRWEIILLPLPKDTCGVLGHKCLESGSGAADISSIAVDGAEDVWLAF